jgi:hypothetical protein
LTGRRVGGRGTRGSVDRRKRFAAAGAEHDAFGRFTDLYLVPVKSAVKAAAPDAEVTNRRALRRSYGREAVKGVPIWQLGQRRSARSEAAVRALRDADQLDQRARDEVVAAQARLDQEWQALHENEPGAVLNSLAAAFNRFPFPSLAVAAREDEAIVFVVLDEDIVPMVEPGVTPTGRLTARKIKKSDRNWHLLEAIASVCIHGSRRALAAAPGCSVGTCVVVRDAARGYEPVAALRLSRSSDHGWRRESSPRVPFARAGGRLNASDSTNRAKRADLSSWPAVDAATKAIRHGATPEQTAETHQFSYGVSLRFV